VFVEDVQDPYYDGMVFLFCLAVENEDVIHVDYYDSFIDEFSEDVVHHCLECCQAVSETKEHDNGLKQASVCPKGCLPLGAVLDSHIVISHWTSSLVKHFTLALDTILRMSGSGEGGRHSLQSVH